MEQSFFEQEIVKKMHPEKVAVLKELDQASKGKNLKDAAPLIIQANQRLKSKNLAFSKEESELLIDILSQDMSMQEKTKLEMMKKMIKIVRMVLED